MNRQPIPSEDYCSECGQPLHQHSHDSLCLTSFDRRLQDLDVGFLESYRKFGCRSRLIVAETCLRGLVVESPDHRKVLAMTIMEQYVLALSDLAGLYLAFRNRDNASILKSFLEFRLDADTAYEFFEAIHSLSDAELLASLDLPHPYAVATSFPHLNEKESYELQVAVHHLMLDIRKATDESSALALAQFAGHAGAMVIASDANWIESAGRDMPADQVAMLVLDSRRRSLVVQGLTADENAMGSVVDALDTVTRAGSNLIYAYLQSHDL